MSYQDEQQAAKYAALQSMAAGQKLGPDPMAGAQQSALQRAAQTATGVPADYQSSLDQQVAGPKQVADRAISNNDSAAAGVIGSANNYGATAGGATSLPAVQTSSAGTTGADTTAMLTKLLAQYNTKLNPGGYSQYGGYQTAGEHDAAVLGRANDLANQAVTGDAERAAANQQAAKAGIVGSYTGQPVPAGQTDAYAQQYPTMQGYQMALARSDAGQQAAHDPWTQGFLQLGANTVAADTGTQAPVVHVLPPSNGGDVLGQLIGAGSVPGGGGVPPAPPTVDASRLPRSNLTPTDMALLSGVVGHQFDPRVDSLGGDPRNLFQFARMADTQLGVDPYIAAGQWTPQWSNDYATNLTASQNAYDAAQIQANERSANAARYGVPMTNAEVQAGQDDMLRGDPAYASAAKVAQSMLSDYGNAVRNDPTTPAVSPDDLKAELAVNGVAPAIADLIVKDFGGSFPGTNYVPPGPLKDYSGLFPPAPTGVPQASYGLGALG